jgi:hypothetical protein
VKNEIILMDLLLEIDYNNYGYKFQSYKRK